MNTQLPKTISEKEKEVLAFWEENKIFEKSIETPAGEKPLGNFSFYDGPPFATGLPHHGSLMAGTVKDLIPRYQTMKGNTVRRIWGWDCHGLPIENLIEKKLGLKSKKDIEEFGIDRFNKDAYESVLQYEEEWRKIIPRLGRWADMEHAYKTMDATYTESIWWAWKTLYEKGLAYEGSKMMHICPRCETPLAQSEVGLEYNDVTDISVTAKFELVDEPGTYVLAWTTTPWTLPGNTALAVHKDIVYAKVKSIYEAVGYQVLSMSIEKGDGVEAVKSLLKDKVTLLSGHSGVGKSTFINAVFPELKLKTQDVSDWSGKGLHTTTFAEMFDIPGGGKIIDTPGIRELGLVDIPKEELSHYFPEMRALINDCKFNNCMHLNEPGCAVKTAVEDGSIHIDRYISYCNILETINEKSY